MAFGLRMALCALLTVMAVLLCVPCMSVLAVATDEGKAIAIAYDNSDSMFKGTTKWNAAEYSVEVLAAMLDPDDSLAIFAMDEPGMKISVEGSQPATERVSVIHGNGLGHGDYTYTRPAQEAFDYLKTTRQPKRYLVITTDGQFGDEGHDIVQSIANDAAASGIQVEYLAIGDDAVDIAGDPSAGITVERAGSDNILEIMTKIANQIFGRAELRPQDVDLATGSLTLDVPMEQIVIFAQGENVSLGPLTNDETTVEATQVVDVKRPDVPYPGANPSEYATDDQLQGVVATYGAAPAGIYSIDASGAQSVAVYYKPRVKIAVGLTDENGETCDLVPNGSNELFAGTFTPTFTLLNPDTDQPMESDLLNPATYTLEVTQNGTENDVHEGESFPLSTGTADFTATVETRGGATADEHYQGITVSPTPVNLTVDASSLPDRIGVADFPDASYPVTVTHDDGSPLSQAEWDALEPSVTDDSGVVWTAEKSDDGKTITVRPTYENGDEWATEQRLFGFAGIWPNHTSDVQVNAGFQVGDVAYQGHDGKSVTYTPDIVDVLRNTWFYLAILAIALAIIIALIRKPRLPRGMKPNIDVGNRGTKVYLSYSDNKIKHTLSLIGPETVTFSIIPSAAVQQRAYPFANMFPVTEISLVAMKKRRGRHGSIRQFYLADTTAGKMNAVNANPGNFPNPNYTPIYGSGVKSGKLGYSAGSNITFNGRNAAGKRTIPFTLYFK